MKTSFKKIPLAFVVVFIAATANAACGDFDKRNLASAVMESRHFPFRLVTHHFRT